jgi:hypothetical protein
LVVTNLTLNTGGATAASLAGSSKGDLPGAPARLHAGPELANARVAASKILRMGRTIAREARSQKPVVTPSSASRGPRRSRAAQAGWARRSP